MRSGKYSQGRKILLSSDDRCRQILRSEVDKEEIVLCVWGTVLPKGSKFDDLASRHSLFFLLLFIALLSSCQPASQQSENKELQKTTFSLYLAG